MINKDPYLVRFQHRLTALEEKVAQSRGHPYSYPEDVTDAAIKRWEDKMELARSAISQVSDIIDMMNHKGLSLRKLARLLDLHNRQCLEHIFNGRNLGFWTDGEAVLQLYKILSDQPTQLEQPNGNDE